MSAINTLLISPNDIKRETAVNYNVDDTVICAAITRAQSLYLEGVLGTALMRRLQTLVYNKINNVAGGEKIDDASAANYKVLLDDHVCPLLVQQSLGELYMQISYKVRNVGVSRETDTNVSSVSADELRQLRSSAETMVAEYATRMSAFLESNKALYPEASSRIKGEISTPLGKCYANTGLWLGRGRTR